MENGPVENLLKKIGEEGRLIRVEGCEIINAIAQGLNVEIKWAEIYGDINIKKVMHLLEESPDGIHIVKSKIKISNCIIFGSVEFCRFKLNSQRDDFPSWDAMVNKRISRDIILRQERKLESEGHVSKNLKNLIFLEDLILSDNEFRGYVSFVGVKFSKRVWVDSKFSNCVYNEEEKTLTYPAYENAALFDDSIFERNEATNASCSCLFDGIVPHIELNDNGIDELDDRPRFSVDFTSCTFEDAASFSGSKFDGHVSFRHVKFSNPAKFNGIVFSESVDFRFASFYRKHHFPETSFFGTNFNGSSWFSYCAFNVMMNFDNVIFNDIVDFNSAKFTSLISFKNATLKHLANFRGVTIVKSGLATFLFKRRATKFNFIPEKIIDYSTNPFLKRYIEDEQWVQSWRESGLLQKKILYFLWCITSLCGRSIGLWSFWSLCVIIFFGMLYSGFSCPSFIENTVIGNFLCWIGPNIHIGSNTVNNWFSGFYFSIVTFSTLGYGDITPANGAAQFWIVLEVLIGYIMLGGLISIFANKFARRS